MSVRFLSTLDLRCLDGPDRLFMLLAPLRCMVDGQMIEVPEGFITDFASVPRLAQAVINNNDPDIQKPSVLHDYLYSLRGAVPGRPTPYTRAQCDDILAQGMKAANSKWPRPSLVWFAVRVGGWLPWSKKQRTADGKVYALASRKPRSRHWPKVRLKHLHGEDWCRSCGTTEKLEVHHIKPFHLFPELELSSANLITLCETPGLMCHLQKGHLGSWRKYNPAIAEQATSKKLGPRDCPVCNGSGWESFGGCGNVAPCSGCGGSGRKNNEISNRA